MRNPTQPPGLRVTLLALLLAWTGLAQARIFIEVVGVDGAVQENVRSHLDLVRFADRDDLSEAAIRRLYERAPRQVRTAMRPFGYYEPEIQSALERQNGDWRVRFEITPGAPVRLTDVNLRVEGPGSDHPAFTTLLATTPLIPGRQLRHWEFDELRGRLDRAAQTHGYFDRHFLERRLEVNPLERSARATLVLYTGEQYRFGEVTVDQEILRNELVDRMVFARTGEPYNNDAVLRTQYALTDSDYFSNVLVDAGTRDPSTLTVPVHVETTPVPRQRIRLGLGYGSDTQVRASATWDWRRLNRRGHRANLQARISQQLYDVNAAYLMPVGDPLTETLGVRTSFVDEDLGDTGSRRGTLGINHRRLLGDQQRNLFVDLVHERTQLPEQPAFTDLRIVPGVSIERFVADDPMMPSIGHRLRAEVRGSHSALGSSNDFLRLHLLAGGIVSPTDRLRVLVRGEFGLGLVGAFGEMPASLRFFAGGDQSVRGYGFNSLGPRDAEGRTLGGRHLMFGSTELQWRVHRWFDLAAFLDTGNALSTFDDPLRTSAGAGVHVITPIGRLRIEGARSITENRAWRLHVSIRPDL